MEPAQLVHTVTDPKPSTPDGLLTQIPFLSI